MSPAESLRIELLRAESRDDLALYRGQATLPPPGATIALEVRVRHDEVVPGGLSADSLAATDDEVLRAALSRTVKTMVVSAVRTAQREGLPPPRRVRRWRAMSDLVPSKRG